MLFDKLKKNTTPKLDPMLADQMLQNVFNVCGSESNTVPLEVLESYGNYRKERFTLQKIVLIVIMILLCMLPFFFIAPRFSAMEKMSTTYTPIYEIRVDSWVPIKSVTATLEGTEIPVYNTGTRMYSIEPGGNGALNVTVTLTNGQFATETIQITSVDTTSPSVTVDHITDNDVYLHVSDEGTGVDYESIFAVDEAGVKVFPITFDPEDGYIVFQYPETALNVYIPDMAGNQLHLVVTPRLGTAQE